MPMDTPATLKELSDYYAKKQPHQIDQLTEETSFLQRVKWEQASHGLWNSFEEITEIEGAALVEMNAPLPTVGAASELKKIDLNIFGGEMECPEDKAKMFGGKEKYFARKMPKILRKSGMSTEKTLLYGNLRAYALDRKGNALDAGGTGNANYSIIALRQVPGETIGLYSPDGFKSGAMFDTMPINGGNIYKDAKGVLVYGMRLKAYFGYQIANHETVASIVNIDLATLPTETMIDDMLDKVRASSASTMLVMHPRLLRALGTEYKSSRLRMGVGEKNFNTMITHWDDIEVVTTRNMLNGTEKKVTVKA
ncbi:hypothetical protein LJC46_04335 [Desulfovibrio sp. OttesenSCG-928-G15]|nr:hypothetical protein [Desulfovibrio sp. OttesenSCG-928-G15]